ncbi:cobalamin biosynthesis protein CobT [Paraburkholderia sabiae]|uniref:Cobalamin biosynthesis protein CobT n=1 Tax=Paraburkholderia sabiae TaxID=273251 RepID=A0ABU9QRH6_9BURK|nr:cobalamin biosynthesis protein CobT [Paraburkholderia sabiae]WJZ79308.1 cobalamin biosynthesis protein CobT [Paraburkholderia sabiae]
MTDAPIRPDDELLAHLSRLARTLTGNDEMEVVMADDGPQLRGNCIVLPSKLIRSDGSVAVLTGYVDQLAARARFSAPDIFARLRSPVTRRIAQVIDDRRACAQLVAGHPGSASFFAAMRMELARDAVERWPQLDWKEKLVWRVERFLWDEQPGAIESSPSLTAALDASADVLAQARMATSTSDSVRVSIDFVKRIRALAAGDVNNMMFTADADGTLDPASVKNEFKTDEPVGTEASSSFDPSSINDGSVAQTQADATAEPSGDGVSSAQRMSPQNRPIFSVPITTQFDEVADLTGKGDAVDWRKLRSAARAQTEPLKVRLERALKADEQTHWKREQERGELDRPSLVKLATSPGYRTPFRTRRVRPGRDAAVSVLIDRSGSMAGRKIELARLCAAALADALTQLGFACEVLGYSSIEDARMRKYHEDWFAAGNSPRGFNRFVERLDLQVYKRFDSDNLNGLACIECGHENPDGEALSWAATRLLERRSHRHILMVLSDGYPATGDGNPAILQTDLRARVEELHSCGVELIGVGILDDAVEAFYPTCSVVEHLQDLPEAAFDVLGRTLLNHRDWMLEKPRV